jgi:hypothetical protein
MMRFQTAQLMCLEREERRLDSGKEGRTKNQDCNDHEQDGQGHGCHFLYWDSQIGCEKSAA